jgi:hypothetical protein
MSDKDMQNLLDNEWLPEDAGEYSEGLIKIIRRIPPRWGRWISCASGWYPLLIELDEKLAQIEPDYEIHQVKEKFGTLRYYIGISDLKPQCCIDIEATQPVEGAINPQWVEEDSRSAKEQYQLDKWFYEVLLPHFDTPEHAVESEALEPERERRYETSNQMHEIIDSYERKSATICELCGSAAEMRSRGYWYRTLCTTCAEKDGYDSIEEEEEK